MTASERQNRLEESALRPLVQTSRAWYLWVGFLAVTIIWGLVGYAYQLRNGLAVTGLGDTVFWGFYIANFVFFIGISHAGTLISAILRVTQAEWRRPITRMAEVITGVALLIGGLMPIVDLGRPDRIPSLIFHGQIGSPIIWDFLSISTYLTGSLIYLYLPLIPDIALARDRLRGQVSPLRWNVYRVLAMGWRDTPAQRHRLERALSIMMILIIPIAVSVHTVVSWIFGMTLRAGWDSTIFGPYFVVGAIFSGTAAIITVMYIFRRIYHLEEYITEKQFRYLGYLLLALGVMYLYFTFSEYLTVAYKLEESEKLLLEALFIGEYALLFWLFLLPGTILPVVLLALPWTRTVPLIVTASVLVNFGMWLKRYVIVVPSLGLPTTPGEWGIYSPTWVELAITVGAFGGFALIFTIFVKLFPIISVWEIAEGWRRTPSSIETTVPATTQPVTEVSGGE